MEPKDVESLSRKIDEVKEETDYQLQAFFEETRTLIQTTKKRYNRIIYVLILLILFELYSTWKISSIQDYAMLMAQHVTNLYENLIQLLMNIK
ncbi:hypothetical protein [Oceanidesulfovibrio marinus]|uniref:Uncharacterized protein n=1 Tax=Oceanidesulfovibrio marinus TaxID=370038 RepID=A0A6P1ZF49_9BACT|nr:hypothetical protein [Oceanidesulfovibrio marinus]QJT11154.1 hypothetical protein E8L03_20560 [Oceanidesulfovibrio marinus]TVM31249.1 hypothetical protein DQK91_19255 [Oceanidesulfovibrio marinus]